jgi:hypothetical protein
MEDGRGEDPGCQFCYWEVVRFTGMDHDVPVTRMYSDALKHYLQMVKARLPEPQAKPAPSGGPPAAGTPRPEDLNLQPGEWVEVRSLEEIRALLDDRHRTSGLVFMDHMTSDCGKRFRVLKKVERIRLETTGQMRRLRAPTVFLEGSVCDVCDRACYCFWREAWLKRVEP